jgi:hypothetical protein
MHGQYDLTTGGSGSQKFQIQFVEVAARNNPLIAKLTAESLDLKDQHPSEI